MRVYAHFCAHHLELNKLRGTIDVHLSRGTLEGDAYGLCWGDNREAEIHIGSIQWGKPIPNEDKLKPIPVLLSGGSGCKGCKFLS